MAAVAVAADSARYDAMDATTNTAGIGGGAGEGAEPDIVYQGTNSVSRKVTNAGFYTTTGATRDLTATGRRTWLVKTWLTNYGSLSTTGNIHEVRVGSGTGDYYNYTIGSPAVDYPAKGGWVIDAIDPNIASHRDGTAGSPVLTACDYFAAFATCSTSKVENLCLDAIDVGYGLYLTGGDGADADGTFQDFVDDDEGDTTNGRFGYVTTQSGVLFVFGRLVIGATAASGALTSVATGFTDTGGTVVFPENRAAAGFSGFDFDYGNASTLIDVSGMAFVSRGTAAGEDTRAVFDVLGTAGTFTMDSGSVTAFASVNLTTAATMAVTFSACGQIDANGATLAGSAVVESTAASAVLWNVASDPNGELDNMTFASAGTGHALELGATSPLTVTLTGQRYSGYAGTDGSTGNEAVWVRRTTGTVTINISGGGDTPTIRTDGAIVNVVNTVTVRVTAVDVATGLAIPGAYVYLESDGSPLPDAASVSITRSGSTATVTHTAHGFDTGDKVAIRGTNEREYQGLKTITVTGVNSYTYTVSGTPATPATGAPTSTAVILAGVTDANGVVENTGFNFASTQPVTGFVRKGTASPVYVTAPLGGSIASTGYDQSVFMSRDE